MKLKENIKLRIMYSKKQQSYLVLGTAAAYIWLQKMALNGTIIGSVCVGRFFHDKIMNELVEGTNIYIESICDIYKDKSEARPTDVLEVKALFRLRYIAGVYHGG
ncbi:hypothetical protein GWI33_016372 [Rhynchophorus ferrugineus]|uniref:Uncharacterized protein n=1 Tax=Rhynchophorus ferrugineus TaxID=354439 RepID=A0A834I079_RHYFE|nr:hypothetical protein GWI33_016372 [Rhynchophorus ferrugineus]